ncbi:hypothetical protein [Aquimarina sp. 2201CG14-23]|uniref:hypothetical protein n=1 Tax=Aquimarina mycalae TaxID=3040073 RepID=UPI002477E7FF|nr:hypothetical protein [Aquimarina sp. 2201CG14-23]MDH7445571.1 hypothetical protein [Aquimarina sp. 2201CG14-23]
MKSAFISILSMFFVISMNAQIEKPLSSLKIDDNSNLKTSKYSLSSGLNKPKNNFSLYNNPKDSLRFNRTQKPFDMTGNNGLLQPNHKVIPKWFKKDKEIKEEYKTDQYLGDFKSSSTYVHLLYRDHESVDGDLVRIYVNDDVIRSNVFLDATFQGLRIDLIKGFNKIDIQALNQGTSGPNTAEFQLYDDLGNLITANEWNLTTGVKATMIIVKD